MILRGQLIAESPIYRGNARKTLFTRDGDGSERLVSLAGEISGTAQSLMDAFIGQSRDGRNIGLLNQLWQRLYDTPLPSDLISSVQCHLNPDSYPRDHFFDMRMGLKLDEDRWAAEANANYKMETIFRHSVFNLSLNVNDNALQKGDNQARLYYLLQELQAGRFWFGAGKSKGLGRCRLEMDLPFAAPEKAPSFHPDANHLRLTLTFNAMNPVLVGWNWGKVDPEIAPAFAAIEGRLLVEAMSDIPDAIRSRLAMAIGGPLLSPEDWKHKFTAYLARITAVWLQEQSSGTAEMWTFPRPAIARLGKGKYPLAKKIMANLEKIVDQPFASEAAAEKAALEALADKSKMIKRVMDTAERSTEARQEFNRDAWQEISDSLGLDPAAGDQLASHIQDEAALADSLVQAMRPLMPRFYDQIDQQINLLQSDSWVDIEIANREEHLRIKTMLRDRQINESQWGDPRQVPQGVSAAGWREFLDAHRRVQYRHMMNDRNLTKSINNDQNFITFLQVYRDRTRQELAQPHHVDFRGGGPSGREISRKYGKPYDNVFMRMLSWAPSTQEQGAWEVYVPGSTLKGAFRKRASQILRTIRGDNRQTNQLLDHLFGAQGQIGRVYFSDAYLTDPYDPDKTWCSMDGVRMNPQTGRPVERAKTDYLYAYGNHLTFQLRLDMQDVGQDDMEALSLLASLLQDFQRGDIPLGGEKTSGFGWVQANISEVNWLTGGNQALTSRLFGDAELSPQGAWQGVQLPGETAVSLLAGLPALTPNGGQAAPTPPRASAGFISHRAFGGHCGTLALEAELLTPTNVRESGEPSYRASLDGGPVNGWDFFAMAPPEAEQRPDVKTYALPSRSLKGMARHLYAIAADAPGDSPNLNNLNPVDSLFGWVGSGTNQALTGRVSFSFGLFDNPELAWFKTPYPYGGWRYENGQWQQKGGPATTHLIGKQWRFFPHAPLAPIAQQMDDFQPDSVQASYFRAIMPGSHCRFTVRFWNLEDEELQRLLWCLTLEPAMGHKIGNHRYLGFGSLRLRLLPDSFLIDWRHRYAGKAEDAWQLPLSADQWHNPQAIKHYQALRKALDAGTL